MLMKVDGGKANKDDMLSGEIMRITKSDKFYHKDYFTSNFDFLFDLEENVHKVM